MLQISPQQAEAFHEAAIRSLMVDIEKHWKDDMPSTYGHTKPEARTAILEDVRRFAELHPGTSACDLALRADMKLVDAASGHRRHGT